MVLRGIIDNNDYDQVHYIYEVTYMSQSQFKFVQIVIVPQMQLPGYQLHIAACI